MGRATVETGSREAVVRPDVERAASLAAARAGKLVVSDVGEGESRRGETARRKKFRNLGLPLTKTDGGNAEKSTVVDQTAG